MVVKYLCCVCSTCQQSYNQPRPADAETRTWVRSERCSFHTSLAELSKSSTVCIPCSVPQGSVLGLRLFILYTADLEDHVAEDGSVSTRSPTTRSYTYTVVATTWCLPFYDSRTASRKSATVCLPTASSWTRTQQSCSGLGHVMVRLCWEALVRRCSLELKRSRRVTKSVSLAWRWRRSDLCLDMHVVSVCATCF